MEARLKVVPNAPALRFMTRKDLEFLAKSFVVQLDPGDEIVHFGENPPADTGKRWQQTDSNGAVIGKIKTYQGGEWK